MDRRFPGARFTRGLRVSPLETEAISGRVFVLQKRAIDVYRLLTY